MPTHVALLRGINVGGRNKVAMAELRDVVSSLGHTDVATYIQSGNVVFTAVGDTRRLGADLERAIAESLGVSPSVVVISRDELAQVVRDNPYPDESNPKAVHVVFLPKRAGREAAGALGEILERAADAGGRDTAKLVGRVIYLHTPDGFGRSKLAEFLMRSARPELVGTARNWATVTRLLDMTWRESS